MDDDIAEFVDLQPRAQTYSELAALIRERFGDERAVSVAHLRDWWCIHHPASAPSKIERDAEVERFVLDRIGRMSAEEITAALANAFAAGRRPSRSTLYRYLAKRRSRTKTAHA